MLLTPMFLNINLRCLRRILLSGHVRGTVGMVLQDEATAWLWEGTGPGIATGQCTGQSVRGHCHSHNCKFPGESFILSSSSSSVGVACNSWNKFFQQLLYVMLTINVSDKTQHCTDRCDQVRSQPRPSLIKISVVIPIQDNRCKKSVFSLQNCTQKVYFWLYLGVPTSFPTCARGRPGAIRAPGLWQRQQRRQQRQRQWQRRQRSPSHPALHSPYLPGTPFYITVKLDKIR